MKKKDKSVHEELAFLGRGIRRTVLRDAGAVVIGIVLGAGAAFLLGYSLKLGVVVGALVGLLAGSFRNPLFDYDSRRDGHDEKRD